MNLKAELGQRLWQELRHSVQVNIRKQALDEERVDMDMERSRQLVKQETLSCLSRELNNHHQGLKVLKRSRKLVKQKHFRAYPGNYATTTKVVWS